MKKFSIIEDFFGVWLVLMDIMYRTGISDRGPSNFKTS